MKNSAMDGDGSGLLLAVESKFYLQPHTHSSVTAHRALEVQSKLENTTL